MRHVDTPGPLTRLSDTDLAGTPLDALHDRLVVDRYGEPIGRIKGYYVDHERRVRLLDLDSGGFLRVGLKHTLLPPSAVRPLPDRRVQLNATRTDVLNAPPFEPSHTTAELVPEWERYYHHYGLDPR